MEEQNPSFLFATSSRMPSPGFSQTQKQKNSQIPWERFVAENGKSTECLLCGRISAHNPWRTRAHFMGGDAHVQVCQELTPEILECIEKHQTGRRKQTRTGRSGSLSSLASNDDFSPSSSSSQPIPPPSSWRSIPKEGFCLELADMNTTPLSNDLSRNLWRANLAFSKEESKAQCLLCNRISKNNLARLKAHYFGGDKHVAVCPFVLRERKKSPDSPILSSLGLLVETTSSLYPTAVMEPRGKRSRIQLRNQKEDDQGFLPFLTAAADVVEQAGPQWLDFTLSPPPVHLNHLQQLISLS